MVRSKLLVTCSL